MCWTLGKKILSSFSTVEHIQLVSVTVCELSMWFSEREAHHEWHVCCVSERKFTSPVLLPFFIRWRGWAPWAMRTAIIITIIIANNVHTSDTDDKSERVEWKVVLRWPEK